MHLLTKFLNIAIITSAINIDTSHQAMTQDSGVVASTLGAVKSRSKQIVQSIPGSSVARCLTATDVELCKKEAKLEHDLRALMLKGTTNVESMQTLKKKLAVPSAYGLNAAQANDIFHQLIKELKFDQQAYELVTSGTSTAATAATVLPTAATSASVLPTAAPSGVTAAIIPSAGMGAVPGLPTLSPVMTTLSPLGGLSVTPPTTALPAVLTTTIAATTIAH